jgi:hypothetical protein
MICPKTFLLISKVNKGQIWPFLNKNSSIAGIPGLNFPAKLKTVQNQLTRSLKNQNNPKLQMGIMIHPDKKGHSKQDWKRRGNKTRQLPTALELSVKSVNVKEFFRPSLRHF